MAAIVDYVFYQNTFYGETIDESSFPRWESLAEDKLKAVLGDKIFSDKNIADYEKPIKKAVCATADLLFEFDFAEKNVANPSGGNVKSMSSGGQSVTFGEANTAVFNSVGNKTTQNRLILDSISDYLGNSGLMYMGEM